jgi:hypothetical protein
MVSVYLDQAPWIALSKARHGRTDGGRYREALDVCRGGVSMGLVEFPLSNGHYIETWRRADADSRRRLAETMIELSEGRTIAKPPDLCDNELDEFLGQEADTTSTRKPWPVFGWGFLHAAGEIPDIPRVAVNAAMETEFLATRPPGFLAHGDGHREFGDLYRDGDAGLFDGIDLGAHASAHRKAIIAVSAVAEITENIGWALERNGLPPDPLGAIGLARPDRNGRQAGAVPANPMALAEAFIGRLPTREAAMRMRELRHQNPAAKWESNDMVDIAYLADAVVHCDVLVTEKQWVHELRRSGLLEQHATSAIADVADLPALLVDLSR